MMNLNPKLVLLVGIGLAVLSVTGIVVRNSPALSKSICYMITEDGNTTNLDYLCSVEDDGVPTTELEDENTVLEVTVETGEGRDLGVLQPGDELPDGSLYISENETLYPTGVRMRSVQREGSYLQEMEFIRPDGSKVQPGEEFSLYEGEVVTLAEPSGDPELQREDRQLYEELMKPYREMLD